MATRAPELVGTTIFVVLVALVGICVRVAVYAWQIHDLSIDGYAVSVCSRDCAWYAQIASLGYDLAPRAEGAANWAFFPLTPIVLSLVHFVTGLSWALCGVLIGHLCMVAACFVAKPLFPSRWAYRLFCVLTLMGPFAYAYALGMSEPLFFLLSIVVFAGLQSRRYVLVGVAALLLTATRVTGIFILVPIAIHCFMVLREQPRTASAFGPTAALCVAPVGLLAFMIFLQVHMGDAIAFVHVQSAWDREISNPLVNVINGLLLKTQSGYRFTMAIFALLGIAGAVYLVARRRVGMALFVLGSLLLSLSTGLTSVVRFTAGLSPLTIAAAEGLSRGPWSFAITGTLATLIGAVTFLMWIGGSPLLT